MTTTTKRPNRTPVLTPAASQVQAQQSITLATRKIAWIKRFRLQNIYPISLPRGVATIETYHALNDLNRRIDSLRRMLDKDLKAYESRLLSPPTDQLKLPL